MSYQRLVCYSPFRWDCERRWSLPVRVRCGTVRGLFATWKSRVASDTLFASANQQCFFLTTNQHQPPIINQPAVFFSHNKSAPATSHSQPNRARNFRWLGLHLTLKKDKILYRWVDNTPTNAQQQCSYFSMTTPSTIPLWALTLLVLFWEIALGYFKG